MMSPIGGEFLSPSSRDRRARRGRRRFYVRRARDDFTEGAPRARSLDVMRARRRRRRCRERRRGVEIRARARGIHAGGRRRGIARGDGAVRVLRRPRTGGRRVRAVAVVGGDDVGGLGAQKRGDGGRGVGVLVRREIVGDVKPGTGHRGGWTSASDSSSSADARTRARRERHRNRHRNVYASRLFRNRNTRVKTFSPGRAADARARRTIRTRRRRRRRRRLKSPRRWASGALARRGRGRIRTRR